MLSTSKDSLSSYISREKRKFPTPNFESYPTPSPTVTQEEARNEAYAVRDETTTYDVYVAPSPPYENCWPANSPEFSVPFYADYGMGAICGQSQNNFLPCENPVEHPIGYPVPTEYLSSYQNASTSTPMPPILWQSSGAAYIGSAVSGLKEGFASDLTSTLGPSEIVRNEVEVQCPDNDDQHREGEPNQSSGPNDIKIDRLKMHSRRKSKSSAVYHHKHETEESLHALALSRNNEFQAQAQYRKAVHSDHKKRVQQRNRVASNNFLVKKKHITQNLQAEEEQLREEHEKLKSEASALRAHVAKLKSNLLNHSRCDSSIIQNYINSQAVNFVRNKVNQTKRPRLEKMHVCPKI